MSHQDISTKGIWSPYGIAMDISLHMGQPELTMKEYTNLVIVFQQTHNEKKRHQVAEFFKTLPREEVLRRAATIARLDKLLKLMNKNGRQCYTEYTDPTINKQDSLAHK